MIPIMGIISSAKTTIVELEISIDRIIKNHPS